MSTPPPGNIPSRPTYRLRDPDEVIAALPYLLGFRPQSSLVVLGVRGGPNELRVTARVDLPQTRPEADTVARTLAAALVRAGADRALLVVVRPEPGTADDRALVRPVVRRLRRSGMTVSGPLEVSDEEVPHPARLGPGVPVPALAVESVVQGRQVFERRADVAALVRRRPEGISAELARALDQIASAQVPADDLEHALDELVRTVRSGVQCASRPPALTAGDLALVCLALRHLPLRDRLLDHVAAEEGSPYDDLLLRVCRTAPEAWVAPAATVLAAGAYLRGDGVLARCALDRALEVEPGYSLARLIELSLDHALPPARLRAALAECFGGRASDPPGASVA